MFDEFNLGVDLGAAGAAVEQVTPNRCCRSPCCSIYMCATENALLGEVRELLQTLPYPSGEALVPRGRLHRADVLFRCLCLRVALTFELGAQ